MEWRTLRNRFDSSLLAHGNYWRRLYLGAVLLIIACIVNFYAGSYATREASSAVTDIVLSNTPRYDVDGMFVYGALVLIAFIVGLCLWKPRRAPFVLFGVSTFILVRSFFISLTHIGPFPDHIAFDLGTLTSKFIFGGDLFFSGHTGIPFLMALVFWREKVLRYIFLAWSIFFGTIALLGHIHYSIDVASAYFITYTIYRMACYFFPREKEWLDGAVA